MLSFKVEYILGLALGVRVIVVVWERVSFFSFYFVLWIRIRYF